MFGKNRTGCLLFLIIFVLLGLVIYSYKDKFSVLYKTGLSIGKDFFNKKFVKKKNKDQQNIKSIIEKIDLSSKKDRLKEKANKIKNDITDIKETLIEDNKIESNKENNKNEKKNINEKKNSKESENKTHSRISTVYFSKIHGDENLNIIGVKREVYFINMPLTETIKELLKGPTDSEKKDEIITNIPQKTKLLSVRIKDNIAYLNFSEEFEHNAFGKEATIAQIKQIIYTVTEFSNIRSVQFLIDGEVKTYLGGEGVLINKPLSRNDFS